MSRKNVQNAQANRCDQYLQFIQFLWEGSNIIDASKGVFELRGRVGVRVYMRRVSDTYEILGYSSKNNQQLVIDRILSGL